MADRVVTRHSDRLTVKTPAAAVVLIFAIWREKSSVVPPGLMDFAADWYCVRDDSRAEQPPTTRSDGYAFGSVEGRGISPPGAAITPSFTSTPSQSAFAWWSTILPSVILSISKTLHVSVWFVGATPNTGPR